MGNPGNSGSMSRGAEGVKTEEKDRGWLNDGIRLLPVILFVTIIPLLVHALPYSMHLSEYSWISADDGTVLWDVFSFVKLRGLMLTVAFSVTVFIILYLQHRIRVKWTPAYIPIAVYTVMVLLSFVDSDLKDTAWRGGMDRFEGTLAIICYMIMLFYTIQAVSSVRDIIIVSCGLGMTVLLECLIGLSQLLGRDVLFSDLGRYLIAGDMAIQLEFEPGQVYQTVGNMNYVPFWLSLAIPLLIIVCIKCIRDMAMQEGNGGIRKEAAVLLTAFLLLVLAALNCKGAGSLGGMLGIGVAVAAAGIAFIPGMVPRAVAIAVISVSVISMVGYYYFTEKDEQVIDYFETGEDSLAMSINGQRLTASLSKEGDIVLSDVNGDEVKNDEDETGMVSPAEDLGYGNIAFERYEMGGESYVMVHFISDDVLFHFGGDQVTCCNPYGYEISLSRVERLGFYGHYSFGSGRGYIWADSLPLALRHLFIGSGADTFMLVFPQSDYAGKISSGGKTATIVDKAHSIYLQMAVTTGFISLLAFLVLQVVMLLQVRRRYFMDLKPGGLAASLSWERTIILGMAFGVMGFLIGGLTCDSTVSVMPIYYTALGTILGACAGKEPQS